MHFNKAHMVLKSSTARLRFMIGKGDVLTKALHGRTSVYMRGIGRGGRVDRAQASRAEDLVKPMTHKIQNGDGLYFFNPSAAPP